ncbi:MAG: GGDEF domain-containing protein, partial [Acidobacteriota bacterium]
MELAGKEFQRSKRKSLDLSMLLFDVDHFKDINDTFGHPAGDDVLVGVCREVEEVLRRYDIFARYGGDEFTVLFPQTRMADALSVAERISQKVYGMKLSSIRNHPITISGGLTSLSGDHESIDSLLKAADKALYMAKKRGRGRIVARDR